MTTVYKFKAVFTKDGVLTAPIPAPVARVVDVDADNALVEGQAVRALTSLPGSYTYEYEGADNLDLECKFHTEDIGTDQRDLVSYVVEKVYQADVKLDTIDGVADAIQAKTDNLPASPAPADEYDAELAALQADLDNPDQYKADVSLLALEATLDEIKGMGWTNETLRAIYDEIDGLEDLTAADIWTYVDRTLTDIGDSGIASESTVESLRAIIRQYSGIVLRHTSSNDVYMQRSADFEWEFYGLGDLTGRESLYFTVKLMKEKDSATDAQSIIQIEETEGLLYIDQGEAGAPANGAITVTDEIAGNITVTLDAEETDKLTPNLSYRFDVKKDNTIMTYGKHFISTSITRTIT
jgi:hypothetical protein